MTGVRLHVQRAEKRTTVSMDSVLVSLMSLRLCGKVDVGKVAEWCQERINEDPGAYSSSASQRLSSRAALEIAPKALQDAYWDNILASERKQRGRAEGARRTRKASPGKRGTG